MLKDIVCLVKMVKKEIMPVKTIEKFIISTHEIDYETRNASKRTHVEAHVVGVSSRGGAVNIATDLSPFLPGSPSLAGAAPPRTPLKDDGTRHTCVSFSFRDKIPVSFKLVPYTFSFLFS